MDISHNYGEYAKLFLLSSGGASAALQVAFKKSSPDKVVKVISRMAQSLGATPPSPSKIAKPIQWIQNNQGTIVSHVGMGTCFYKSVQDSRESQLQWAAQEEKNKVQDTAIQNLSLKFEHLEKSLINKNNQIEELENQTVSLKKQVELFKTTTVKTNSVFSLLFKKPNP
jgi:hypothetical protein